MTARALSPDAPGEEAAQRRDQGAMSPPPWCVDEACMVIRDAEGRGVLLASVACSRDRALANMRAVVAAINVLGGRHA